MGNSKETSKNQDVDSQCSLAGRYNTTLFLLGSYPPWIVLKFQKWSGSPRIRIRLPDLDPRVKSTLVLLDKKPDGNEKLLDFLICEKISVIKIQLIWTHPFKLSVLLMLYSICAVLNHVFLFHITSLEIDDYPHSHAPKFLQSGSISQLF
jgi:hypothetical protein